MGQRSRRAFLQSISAAAGAMFAGNAARGADAPRTSTAKPRSVMLLIADDWGIDAAGCYGNRAIRTPHIDALAEKAIRFTQAFAVTPSCSASRATILTGLYGHQSGQYGHAHAPANFRTHEHVRSLPKILGEAGLACGVVGKLHVEPESVYPWDYAKSPRGGIRNVQGMAECVGEFLGQNRNKPFYLHVGFGDPHRNFGNGPAYPGVQEVKYAPEDVIVPPWLPDHPLVREDLAQYWQSVSRFDQGIAMCLKALEEAGRAEDTLVIVTSDHGMPFPGCKAASYDSGHRVPFLVWHAGLARPGGSNDALLNFCNFAPTVCDWCGVKPPTGLPERSFLPILEEEHPAGWDETFFAHNFHELQMHYPYRVLRGRQYKFVENIVSGAVNQLPSDLWSSPTWRAVRENGLRQMGQRSVEAFLNQPAEALYDIQSDPQETRNRIADPTLAGVAEAMRARLQDFRLRTADPWLDASIQAAEPNLEERVRQYQAERQRRARQRQ